MRNLAAKDLYFVAVKMFLRRKNTLLIIKDVFGDWDLPGGRIRTNEFATPLNKIIERKAREELGLTIRYTLGQAIVFMRHERRERSLHKPVRIFAIGFAAHWTKGEVRLSSTHSEFLWVPLSSLRPQQYFTGGWLKGVEEYLRLTRKPADMDRAQAISIINQHIQNPNLKKHLLAAEAVMRRLAEHFGENADEWALTGLLHDVDWEKTKDNFPEHTLMAERILTEAGLAPHIVKAIKVHNWHHGIAPETLLEKTLFCVEELTGLITAAALVQPSKKLADVSVESVLKKFKEKSFAKGVNRDIIAKAPDMIGLSLEAVTRLSLEAMRSISPELGL
ncbi:HDIG domain-containing protein [Candidatus Parcubacteria bacterium]|nr:HDIG domain-containing protein [Candidatus Parcubacteria bacterium]